MNVLELFAGIGGISLGLERAGMTVVGQVEISPFCQDVLRKHWPDVPRHDDVRTTLEWWRSDARPGVDVIAGGYPCQGESAAGKRRGIQDERWLWPDFARIVHALRPRWVIGENVIGHRTGGLRFVMRDLDRLGYAARAGTVRASDLGAPHQRARIFVIAADTARGLAVPKGLGRGARRTWRPLGGGTDRQEFAPEGLAYPDGDRSQGGGSVRATTGRETASALRRRSADPGETYGRHWESEPDVGRVAHGVPSRVDRLRGLGNAVVPQVAEYIGGLVADADRAGKTGTSQ